MLREIQQVLRLVMLLGKQRHRRSLKTAGGLLVFLWTETGVSVQNLICTVAAAGPWSTGIKMKELWPVLTDVKESMFPCVWPSPQPDPEELCAFTDLYGSLRLLLSFQMKDARLFSPEWRGCIEAFLHAFSLVNAGIRIHFKLKFREQTFQREFRVKITSKVAWAKQSSLILDVTSRTQPPECVKKGCWCLGGHPVLGGRLPLSIPPEAMDQGLFGELSVQPLTILSPCVLQYPNLATQLTHIQISFADFTTVMWLVFVERISSCSRFVEASALRAFCRGCSSAGFVRSGIPVRTGTVLQLTIRGEGLKINTSKSKAIVLPLDQCDHVMVCSPSNVPVTGPSTFFQNLPAHLDCQELGLHSLRYSSAKDLVHSSGTVYTVEQENWEDSEQQSGPPSVQQRLLLFLFLQHSDPFIYHLSDFMATEVLIERHLEDILNNNRRAVTAALQTELKNTLETQNRRKKDQEKLRSAAEVILSSSIGIVSCSSNKDFRNACLNSMKVHDTHELSASLCESLRRVTSWKFIPKGRCYSAQMEEHPESDEPARTEI